jgi:hypothetical protein
MSSHSRSDFSSGPGSNTSPGRRGFLTALLVSTAFWLVRKSFALVRFGRDIASTPAITSHKQATFKEEKCL